jgi:hypothetical protein
MPTLLETYGRMLCWCEQRNPLNVFYVYVLVCFGTKRRTA